MNVLDEGHGELCGWMSPDDARKWMMEKKSRTLTDKRVSMREAVKEYTRDGEYFAMGGFGHIRLSMQGIYELIRQRRRNLTMAGKTSVHDVDILIGGDVVDRIECAYAHGHELRGLSPCGRRATESGKVKIVAELSNAAFQWRFKAASMGLPWLPARIMMGTDTFKYSSSKIVEDPFTGDPITLIPACYPDFAFIHVHRCDRFGNCQIDGTTIEDIELSRAAKRLIVTTEEIIPHDEIIDHPDRTAIPFFLVDAVVESKFGSHPGNMPGLYYSDEEHMAEWLKLSRSEAGVQEYLDKYIYGVESQEEYLERIGGLEKMVYLARLENLEVPLRAPWRS
jgi:acyl CoA:acetate/3-ketoacid CoA transferase alpha subunit